MPSCPFPDRVLAWGARFGRRDLPWQQPRTPYRVWVSEIMLQQTQVSTVIPYFERWMARFPDLEALAAASEDEVLSLWSGLGYYARARNLHRAARDCVERFRGNVPGSFRELTELPGIGRSTANAILSQAFGKPAAVLDGNVKRLLARHAAVEGWPGDASVQRALWREAEARLPEERAADYSQAMMDLGATVCTRNKPCCGQCPVSDDCEARRAGAVERIPAPRPRKTVPEKIVHMLVVKDEKGRVLLERRPPSGIWGGLWSLPEAETRKAAIDELLPRRSNGVGLRALPDREHRLTHLQLRIRPCVLMLGQGGPEPCELRERAGQSWFARAAWSQLGLPKPVREILEGIA